MKKRGIAGKLKSKKGESISEVLAATLIASLALILLASMIAASASMVEKGRDKTDLYVRAENGVADQAVSAGEGTVTAKEGSDAIRLSDDSGESIGVSYYENKEIGGDPVVSYKVN